MPCVDLDSRERVEVSSSRGRDERFGFGDVRFAKEELAIEIREVDGVEIDLEVSVQISSFSHREEAARGWKGTHDFDFGETDENEVLH
jgi:hypothetical protein